MAEETRSVYKSGVSASIYTNTQKLIKGNTVRDKFLVLADSVLFLEDANVAGGFLAIDDTNVNVDVSFIKSISQNGNFLRDDGTWSSLTANPVSGTFLFESGQGIDVAETEEEDVLNIGTTFAEVINYGHSGTTHNFLGSAIYENQVNTFVTDKLITLNNGGAEASGVGCGFEIIENASITGYFKTNGSRNGFSLKAPHIEYYADLNTNLLSANRAYSLPNTSGTLVVGTVTDTLIPFGSSGALTTNEAFRFNSEKLFLGTSAPSYSYNFNIKSSVGGGLPNGISVENTHNGGFSNIIFMEGPNNYAYFGKFNSAMSGTVAGTSIPFVNLGFLTSSTGTAAPGNGPIGITGSRHYILAGRTSTNKGIHLDSSGVRIDTLANLHTSNNDYALEVQGRNSTQAVALLGNNNGSFTLGFNSNGIVIQPTSESKGAALYNTSANTYINVKGSGGIEAEGQLSLSSNGYPLLVYSKDNNGAKIALRGTGGIQAYLGCDSSNVFTVANSGTEIVFGVDSSSITYAADLRVHNHSIFGGDETPTALVDIEAASTDYASLRIRSTDPMDTPLDPPEGSIWSDGNDLWIFIRGAARKFTLE